MDQKNNSFLFPAQVKWEKGSYRDNYGKMVVEPLERGYGVTIGNALRRVLLSSIPGIAVSGIRVEGVLHEFTSLEGMTEDITQLAINLKQVALKKVVSEFPRTLTVKISNKSEIIAEDLFSDESVVVLNPALHIATVDDQKEFEISLEITEGIGYLAADDLKRGKQSDLIGLIHLDAIYTPVKKVAFHVESARVGQAVDYERLILEIWTTGAVSPLEAVEHATHLLDKHFEIIREQQGIGEKSVPVLQKSEEGEDFSISELKLSTRIVNVLTAENINTLSDMLRKPKEEFLTMKNLGKKSIEELEEALSRRNLRLLTQEEISQKAE